MNDLDICNFVKEYDSHLINLTSQKELLLNLKNILEDINNKYINLYEFSPIPYFTFNSIGFITEINQLAANLLSLNKDELIQQPFQRYIAPESQETFSHHCKVMSQEHSIKICELKLLQRCGALFYIQLTSKKIHDPSSGKIQILSFVSHIYGRAPNDHTASHNYLDYDKSDKSIEELIRIICHELNHPLAVINNYLNGCIIRLEKNNFNIAELLTILKRTIQQSQRINEIILKMRNFTYNNIQQFELLCINTITNNAVILLHNELNGFEIKIFLRLTNHLPLVKMDRVHIEQVILNIFRNAIDAMRDAQSHDPQLIVETNFIDSSRIEIAIFDNGPGVPFHLVSKLFDPYFTTKSYGMGIGLAICKTIIKKHGGSIFFEENPRGGACIRIILPIQNNTKLKKIF